jgi:hypothetical protein
LVVASSGGLEVVVDVDPYRVQRRAWRRPFPARPAAPEWSQQCWAWCCEHGGGRTGPTVVGMASRRPTVMIWPCRFTRKRFEGAAGPPSRARRVSRTGVGAQGHGADTGRIAQSPTVAGMGSPRELVRQGWGMSPRRMMAPPRRCQSIKCPYPRAGTDVHVQKPRARRR